MASTQSIGSIYLLSVLLLMLQSQRGSFAPTHHLKVSVSGKMPTLIVTSGDVGITSNAESNATNLKIPSHLLDEAELTTRWMPTTPPQTLTTTKWLHKTNQLKTKGKSLKSIYEKKRDKSTKEISTTTEQSKNLMASSSVSPFVSQNVKTLAETLRTTTPPAKDTNLITTEQQAGLPDIEAAVSNEFQTETERTTSSFATATATLLHTETSTTGILGKQEETMKTDTTTSTTTGNLPHRSPTSPTESHSNLKIMLPLTTTTTRAPNMITASTTTVAKIILTTPTTPPSSRSNVDIPFDGNVKALPQAISAKNEPAMKTSSMFAAKLTPSPTPVITTDVNGVSGIEGIKMATPSTAAAKMANEFTEATAYDSQGSNNREVITITSSPISVMSTQASVNATILTTPKEKLTERNAKIFATESTIDLQNTESPAPVKDEETAQHAVVKLIDLEKHSLDELRTKGQGHTQLTYAGHDGVKQTKKKQLLDKHFIVDATTELDFETDIDTSTLLPISTTAVEPVAMNETSSVEQHTIEKPTFVAPTSMPVYNGYLGPIRMDERTFSVHKAHERAKAHEHEMSIESKLHEGRIIEIIAPTALLEQDTTTTTTKLMPNDFTVGTVQPQRNTEQVQRDVLSTTLFQVEEPSQLTTKEPIILSKSDERRESKISDIQIEVYDGVVEKRKYNEKIKRNYAERGTTRPPLMLPTTQERFTQYVVDRTEASTPDTIADSNTTFLGIGKPEPAAIEIHINVSEGIANQSEDLEFLYRQEERTPNDANESYDNPTKTFSPSQSHVLPTSSNTEPKNDDVLVVEIIDTGDNSTEIQSTNLSDIKSVVTFHTESSVETSALKMADELFMADLDRNGKSDFVKPAALPPPPPPPRASNVDRDSDTIFYISNTEVKVGESPPSSLSQESNHQERRPHLESQFFPEKPGSHANAAFGSQRLHPKHLYEEDIILSPVHNTADSLKIFRSQDDGSPPLDITYVGESVIEVEQSSGGGTVGATTTSVTYATAPPSQTPDVIIQPAILPEMSIGVPVIGELPPQIELKEIDFMPNEANQQRSGVYETENNDIEENLSSNNNDMDRLVESSIQYGGDLIDEGAEGGGGFDGMEGAYPFGNLPAMRKRTKNNGAADYAHFAMHHGVNNLRKDELSVDVGNVANVAQGVLGNNENNTTAFQSANETSASMNITSAIAERIEGNATAFATAEQTEEVLQRRTAHEFGSFELLFIGGILMLLTVVTLMASYVSCHIYKRVHGNAQESESSDINLPNGAVARCEDGEAESKTDESSAAPPTPPSTKDVSSEHDSTNDRNCLPPEHADSFNLKKPSNSSNSLNNVNEKHITDRFINKRSTDTSRTLDSQDANGQSSNSSVPDSYAGPNGSVTKMTLKNNHLIVETEERNDISRDARETKMHYTSDKDGVFVVEVARGIDSTIILETPIAELSDDHHLFIKQPKLNGNNNKSPTRKYEDEPAVLSNHEQVQIHQPPTDLPSTNTERSLHQIEEVEEEAMLSPKEDTRVEMNFEKNTNTGLSQSDLSSTSSGDSNKRYTYGNQELYTIDSTGYASSSPATLIVSPKEQMENKLSDDDRTSENGHNGNETLQEASKGNNTEEHCEQQNTSKNKPKSEELLRNEMPEQEKKTVEEQMEEQKKEKVQAESLQVIKEVECEVEKMEEMTPEAAVALETVEIQSEARQHSGEPTHSAGIKEEIMQNDVKEESMSVSELEFAVDSVNSDTTDTTQRLAQIKTTTFTNDSPQDIPTDFESLAQAETDPEFAYDSLMSLPDPPSMNDEMIQYNEYNGTETSQLDSLPPPPPPAALLTDENTNMPDIVAEIKSKQCHIQSINGNMEFYAGHGNSNGHGHGHEISVDQNRAQVLPLPPPILEEINSNGKMLANSPLTPPESPPPSPPAQYSNGVIGMNEQFCAASVRAVAVDVNGS